jgi:hypothetical protein
MKNNSSKKFYAWFDVSSTRKSFDMFNSIYLFYLDNLDSERCWTRKYIEFDQTQRTLTFHSNEVCHFLSDFYKQ